MAEQRSIDRNELFEKLDRDIDNYMESLAKKEVASEDQKPFNFDDWCKELDQHPAFMTELKPNADGEYSEAIQALQALKYDTDDPEDLVVEAEHHKLEGNKHFKCKKYRWAVECYTNGIKLACADRALNSVLYANRAAAHFALINHRSAFRDCFFARRFNPKNLKAIVRGAECLLKLGYGKQCVEWVNTSRINDELKNSDDAIKLQKLDDLHEKAKQLAKLNERDERKKQVMETREVAAKTKLLQALAARKITFKPSIAFDEPQDFEWSEINVDIPWLETEQRVNLDGHGKLHWPILLQYPEVGKIDVLTDCCEDSELGDVVRPALEQSPDDKIEFRQDNVRFFIEVDDGDECHVAEMETSTKVRQIMSWKGFVIRKGLPVILLYTKQHAEMNICKVDGNLYRIK